MERARGGPYQLVMLTLCLFALGAWAVDGVARLTLETQRILEAADLVVCAVFLGDFLVQLATAENRWRYFVRWGWIDLLSSIPMVDALRFGRAARVLRILRLPRGVRATRVLVGFLLGRRGEGGAVSAALLTLLLLVSGSLAILQFERVEGANIRTTGDAVWWAVTAITTVGYGDRFPVTCDVGGPRGC